MSLGDVIERLRLERLPPFLRVLLVTDGTVTRSLAAFFLEPIVLDILTHTAVVSEHSYLQIGVACGDRIICVG